MESIKIELSKELAEILASRLLTSEINLQEGIMRAEEIVDDFRFMEVRKMIVNECISLIEVINEKNGKK